MAHEYLAYRRLDRVYRSWARALLRNEWNIRYAIEFNDVCFCWAQRIWALPFWETILSRVVFF